jgi:hypothetical protein
MIFASYLGAVGFVWSVWFSTEVPQLVLVCGFSWSSCKGFFFPRWTLPGIRFSGIQCWSAFVFLAKNSQRGSTLLAQFCSIPALAKAVATSYVVSGLKISVPLAQSLGSLDCAAPKVSDLFLPVPCVRESERRSALSCSWDFPQRQLHFLSAGLFFLSPICCCRSGPARFLAQFFLGGSAGHYSDVAVWVLLRMFCTDSSSSGTEVEPRVLQKCVRTWFVNAWINLIFPVSIVTGWSRYRFLTTGLKKLEIF